MEIKCPYCHRGENIEVSATQDEKICLRQWGTCTHAYFLLSANKVVLYVMLITVYTFTNDSEHDLTTCILPELIEKWYTRSMLYHLVPTMTLTTLIVMSLVLTLIAIVKALKRAE